ncbi:hypothetical protein QVD17_05153 [Tagetes erecta]|uniref:Uncharacterized protein n=1 Tax=Tagetes erecta TaxID=13708 RepID=A0AAD8PB93_TARER|nr:hypothetical protein QVD17_05153 [Tagetes erecta]
MLTYVGEKALYGRVQKLTHKNLIDRKVRKRLLTFILAAVQQSPGFVEILKKPIVDRFGEAYDIPEKENQCEYEARQ